VSVRSFDIGQLGGVVGGEIQVGGTLQVAIDVDDRSISTKLMRSQMGWREYSRKVWSRSYEWERPPTRALTGIQINIVITNVSGALVGKIRTDIQKSIVVSFEFTDDEQGSADFKLVLSKQPPFELLAMSVITVRVGDSDFSWYTGIILDPPSQGTDRTEITIKGFGLRKYLERYQAVTNFPAGTDITEIVSSIAQNFIANRGPIGFEPSKIDPNSGIVISQEIELGKYSIRHVLDIMALMATTDDFYYIWGVDGDGDFYWTKKLVINLERTFWVGFNLNDFFPRTSFQDIVNSWTLLRAQGKGSGGVGYSVAGIFTDESSAAKFGVSVDEQQIPGFTGEADTALIGNALLAASKDPVESARSKGWLARNSFEFLTQGLYRFVMPREDFQETVDDLDDATAFSVIGGGDLVVSDDKVTFMFADGSVKLAFTESVGTRAELDIDVEGIIKQVIFYVRATKKGDYLTVGVGSSIWDQHTFDFDISLTGTFIPIVWDLSGKGIRKLGKFAIEVNQSQVSETRVQIDKLDIVFAGHKTYRMIRKRSTYRYSPGRHGVDSEFGDLPDSLPQYIAAQQKITQELRATQEVLD